MTSKKVSVDEQAVAHSFLHLMSELDFAEADRSDVENAKSLIEKLFKVTADAKAAAYDKKMDLVAAMKNYESVLFADPTKDEKFVSFVELLKKKGYFANCEPGSEEYEKRMKKAVEKYQARNTLTADQLKQKGNELMSECKFQEAVHAYTRAIEIDGSNHVYYANRAAAQTYLKDYRAAVLDCERAIAIDPNYVKAYARLGNALFHEKQYEKAVKAYTRALELDPENVNYKTDLKLAEEQWEESKREAARSSSNSLYPGLPGLDMEKVNQMMTNPEMMKMAFQMAQNPGFNQMMREASQHMRGTTPEEQMASLMQYMKTPDGSGTLRSPWGNVNQEQLRKIQEEAARDSPKIRAIMEEVRATGPDAFYKYFGDPEVMALMTKMMEASGASGDGGAASGEEGPPPLI